MLKRVFFLDTWSLLFFLFFKTDPEIECRVELVHLEEGFLGLRDLLLEVEDTVDLDPKPEVELGDDGTEMKQLDYYKSDNRLFTKPRKYLKKS